MVKRENLFHELLHAVWEKAKLDETYARSTEEFVISSLGGWLLDTLKDNPDLRDYLFEEGEDGG